MNKLSSNLWKICLAASLIVPWLWTDAYSTEKDKKGNAKVERKVEKPLIKEYVAGQTETFVADPSSAEGDAVFEQSAAFGFLFDTLEADIWKNDGKMTYQLALTYLPMFCESYSEKEISDSDLKKMSAYIEKMVWTMSQYYNDIIQAVRDNDFWNFWNILNWSLEFSDTVVSKCQKTKALDPQIIWSYTQLLDKISGYIEHINRIQRGWRLFYRLNNVLEKVVRQYYIIKKCKLKEGCFIDDNASLERINWILFRIFEIINREVDKSIKTGNQKDLNEELGLLIWSLGNTIKVLKQWSGFEINEEALVNKINLKLKEIEEAKKLKEIEEASWMNFSISLSPSLKTWLTKFWIWIWSLLSVFFVGRKLVRGFRSRSSRRKINQSTVWYNSWNSNDANPEIPMEPLYVPESSARFPNDLVSEPGDLNQIPIDSQVELSDKSGGLNISAGRGDEKSEPSVFVPAEATVRPDDWITRRMDEVEQKAQKGEELLIIIKKSSTVSEWVVWRQADKERRLKLGDLVELRASSQPTKSMIFSFVTEKNDIKDVNQHLLDKLKQWQISIIDDFVSDVNVLNSNSYYRWTVVNNFSDWSQYYTVILCSNAMIILVQEPIVDIQIDASEVHNDPAATYRAKSHEKERAEMYVTRFGMWTSGGVNNWELVVQPSKLKLPPPRRRASPVDLDKISPINLQRESWAISRSNWANNLPQVKQRIGFNESTSDLIKTLENQAFNNLRKKFISTEFEFDIKQSNISLINNLFQLLATWLEAASDLILFKQIDLIRITEWETNNANVEYIDDSGAIKGVLKISINFLNLVNIDLRDILSWAIEKARWREQWLVLWKYIWNSLLYRQEMHNRLSRQRFQVIVNDEIITRRDVVLRIFGILSSLLLHRNPKLCLVVITWNSSWSSYIYYEEEVQTLFLNLSADAIDNLATSEFDSIKHVLTTIPDASESDKMDKARNSTNLLKQIAWWRKYL